jgi:hypothetical protein
VLVMYVLYLKPLPLAGATSFLREKVPLNLDLLGTPHPPLVDQHWSLNVGLLSTEWVSLSVGVALSGFIIEIIFGAQSLCLHT